MLKAAWEMFRMDLALERATHERMAAMGLFALLCAAMFHFSVFAEPRVVAHASAGGVWVVFFFAAALGLSRSFSAEAEAGAHEALAMSPVPPEALYAGKTAANALLLFLTHAGVWTAFGLFFGAGAAPLEGVFEKLALSAAACWAASSAGVLVASMSAHARRRETLFPLLFFPLVMPALICAAAGWLRASSGEGAGDFLQLTLACAILYFSLGWLLFSHVIKE